MMVSNASGERSFSKLKFLKNQYRSTMGQIRLNSLTLMSLENDILKRIDFTDILHDFVDKKMRKKQF